MPQDLFLGAVVPLVTGHTLVITEMDRSSLALCEENPREFPLMDAQRVLGRIVQRARNMRLALRRWDKIAAPFNAPRFVSCPRTPFHFLFEL